MYSIEKRTCGIVGTFRRSPVIRRLGHYAPLAPSRYAPVRVAFFDILQQDDLQKILSGYKDCVSYLAVQQNVLLPTPKIVMD